METEREKLIELRNKLAEFCRGFEIPTINDDRIEVVELASEDEDI